MYFIRHGQSTFNQIINQTGLDPNIPDAPLSSLGRQQVRTSARKAKDMGIDLLISSPYTRALQTASIVSEMIGLPIYVEPLVGERRLYSCDIGQTIKSLKKQWPKASFDGLDESEEWWMPFDETASNVKDRYNRFLKKWEARLTPQTLIASHYYFIYDSIGIPAVNAEIVQRPVY